jgi:cytochrome c5
MRGTFLFLLLFTLISYADDRTLIKQRIKPVGSVQLESDAKNKLIAEPKKVAATKEKQPQTGAQAEKAKDLEVKVDGKPVYDKYCVACHGSGVAGAPKFRESSSWKQRTDKSMSDLLQSVKRGLNAMPPMGMCTNCSNAELKAAIEYMLPKEK